jgi:hypothetical protein
MSDRTAKYDRKDTSPIRHLKDSKIKVQNVTQHQEESESSNFFTKFEQKQQKQKR